MKKYLFPKFDLHLHLDGSLPCATAWELAKKRKPELITQGYEAFREAMQVHPDCHSLHEILACFDLPIQLLQDEEALVKATFDLIQLLDKQGVVYAEIRFAPQQHTHGQLTQRQALQAVIHGGELAKSIFPHIEVQFITCMMVLPFDNDEANWETIQLAHEFLKKGVCALDIAGPEGVKPFSSYRPFFQKAQSLGISYTIHAGESGPAQNVKEAIDMGASRIGHGTSAIDDKNVLAVLKAKQIPLEVCVRSNYVCEVINRYDIHPVRQFYDMGIPVCINTDDMTIIDSDLDREYDVLQSYLHFQDEELLDLNYQAIQAAFLDDERKAYYKQMLADWQKQKE